jgi:hypothetical protein
MEKSINGEEVVDGNTSSSSLSSGSLTIISSSSGTQSFELGCLWQSSRASSHLRSFMSVQGGFVFSPSQDLPVVQVMMEGVGAL